MFKFVIVASLLALGYAAPAPKPGIGYVSGYSAPVVYAAPSVYAAPAVYAAPSVYAAPAVVGHYDTYADVSLAHAPVVKSVAVPVVSHHTDLHYAPSVYDYGVGYGYGHGYGYGYGGYW